MRKIISTTYLFILVLSLIGLSTGYLYYETQSSNIKEELSTKINLKEELFKLRFQLAVGQLENTARIKQVKKAIARMKTVLSEEAR